METQVLAVYGTSYGQTEKVVKRIADRLEAQGLRVVTVRGDQLRPTLRLDEFDGFLVAASVVQGHHQRYIERFVRAHRTELRAASSAFISVSGAAASASLPERAAAEANIQKFFDATHWFPATHRTFGGGFPFTKYNFIVKFFMKRICRKEGLTDFSKDHDLTDWKAVDRFAEELLKLYQAPLVGVTTA